MFARTKRLRHLLNDDEADNQANAHVHNYHVLGRTEGALPHDTTSSPDLSPERDDESSLTDVPSAAMKKLRKCFSMINLETVLSIMTIYGSASFTTRQYDHLCGVVDIAAAFTTILYDAQYGSLQGAAASQVSCLPSSSSIRKVRWPFIVEHLFPMSHVVKLNRRNRFSTAATLIDQLQSTTEVPDGTPVQAVATSSVNNQQHPFLVHGSDNEGDITAQEKNPQDVEDEPLLDAPQCDDDEQERLTHKAQIMSEGD